MILEYMCVYICLCFLMCFFFLLSVLQCQRLLGLLFLLSLALDLCEFTHQFLNGRISKKTISKKTKLHQNYIFITSSFRTFPFLFRGLRFASRFPAPKHLCLAVPTVFCKENDTKAVSKCCCLCCWSC